MAGLSDPRLDRFAQALAFGFTPMSAAEAAGLSFENLEATIMAQDPEVVARVNEVSRNDFYDSSLEHVRIARMLEVDRDFAYRMGNPAAAINATVNRAKLLGHFVERTESRNHVALKTREDLTPEEWAKLYAPKSEG